VEAAAAAVEAADEGGTATIADADAAVAAADEDVVRAMQNRTVIAPTTRMPKSLTAIGKELAPFHSLRSR
jgi:hypothetical protein